MKPAALLVHVSDIKEALEWYKLAFPNANAIYINEFDFTVLEINEFSLEIVKSDEKVEAGAKGTVMYWSVEKNGI